MKGFKITEKTLSRAKQRAEKLPLLNNSIRDGEGTVVAYIGEEIAAKALHGQIEDTFDFDIVYNDNTKVDAKTKERGVAYHDPDRFWCTVAAFNTKQECDEYAFVTVHKDHSVGWYLGKISKKDFYKEAKFFKEGDYDPLSYKNKPFYFKADCYNLLLKTLMEYQR